MNFLLGDHSQLCDYNTVRCGALWFCLITCKTLRPNECTSFTNYNTTSHILPIRLTNDDQTGKQERDGN